MVNIFISWSSEISKAVAKSLLCGRFYILGCLIVLHGNKYERFK